MKKKWVGTGGWRGCYEPVAPVGYQLIVSCSVVNDAYRFLGGLIKKYLRERKVKYRSGFLRTSNVFALNYYLICQDTLDEGLGKEIGDWFVYFSNSTFSIFTGESFELNKEQARRDFFDAIINR